MSYVASRSNRQYVAVEQSYSIAAQASAADRIACRQIKVQQLGALSDRRDKTGSRTYSPAPISLPKRTVFQLGVPLTSQPVASAAPMGALLQGLTGSAGVPCPGLTVAAAGPGTLTSLTAHNLVPGSVVTSGTEVRFVAAVPSSTQVVLNAPFVVPPPIGTTLGNALAYQCANAIPSLTIYDYWDPSTAMQRILAGAVIESGSFAFHGASSEATFTGYAATVLDSWTFTPGTGGLSQFPQEPSPGDWDYSRVGGAVGQVWMGAGGNRFYTLSEMNIGFANNLKLRLNDIGQTNASGFCAGMREIAVDFSILAQDDTQTMNMQQLSRNAATMPFFVQIGNRQGQLMGLYLPAIDLQPVELDDSGSRLSMRFSGNVAIGTNDNDIYFGFA